MPLENINNAYLNEDDLVIKPVQAFADISKIQSAAGTLSDILLTFTTGGTGAKMQSFDTGGGHLTERLAAALLAGPSFTIRFNDNDLDQGSIDSIMATCIDFAQHDGSTATPTLNLSGGNNAVPSPGDVTLLTGAGWTVSHN